MMIANGVENSRGLPGRCVLKRQSSHQFKLSRTSLALQSAKIG